QLWRSRRPQCCRARSPRILPPNELRPVSSHLREPRRISEIIPRTSFTRKTICFMLGAMSKYLNGILASQFEAALCMLHHCVKVCPEKSWEGKIANATVRQIVYHTLFCVDLYLSADAEAFQLRDLHRRGGDERGPTWCKGLNKSGTLEYVDICRRK